MKAVILAAGYATRLYPLTLDRPKPLLEVGGRPILDRLIERLAPIEGVYDVGDREAMKKYSSIVLDEDDRIVSFEEKPEHPEGTLAGIALYFYPRSVLPLVHTYLAEGNNPDQPGRFVEWLYPRQPVYAWRVSGRWYDVGSKETLAEADEVFSKPAQNRRERSDTSS